VAWIAFVGSLAAARHDNLRTNAFDLGYISQTLWNTGHGEPFRLTVLEGATFRPEGLDPSRVRQPHSYLAYHVEPVDLPLAVVYRLWPGPETLLWLQAVVLGLGALPATWLGRRVVGGWAAGVVFGLAWLLAPGLEGAALSDFHAVALGATALMAGLWLWEEGRRGWACGFLLLAAATREDAALAVAWLGVVLLVKDRWAWRIAAPSGLWVLFCFLVIAPYFNGGGSLFASRYAWLWRDPAGFPVGDAAAYLATQLLTGGALCLLAPLQLAAAGPLLVINALSSFDWMRSGGAHYSALLVPPLLWAAAHGARRLTGWLQDRRVAELCGVSLGAVLAAALGAHLWIGASPLRPGFVWPAPDSRAATVLDALAVVPPDAAISASSALYPHLAERHRLYWFPAVQDADWVAVDAGGTTHPLTPAETRELATGMLASGRWSPTRAVDGLLVLRRGEPPVELPNGFYGFARSPAPADPSLIARFGPSIELVGVRLHRWPRVGLFGDAAVLETFWSASAPLREELRFALATTRRPDGALVGLQPDLAAGSLWYPTSRWVPGEVVRMEMPIDRLGGLQALGVAVLDPRGARLPIVGPPELDTWEGGTIARVTSLPR
jgi:uncharacterized membrane protein